MKQCVNTAVCWLLQRNQHPLLIASYMVTIYALVWAMRKSYNVSDWQACILCDQVHDFEITMSLAATEDVFSWCWRDCARFQNHLLRPFCLSAHPCRPASFCKLLQSSFVRGCATISQNTLLLTHPPSFLFSPGTGLICGLRVSRGIEGGKIGANWKAGGNMKGRSWREKVEREQAGEGWC